jgi:hypothetical protein
MRNTRRSPNMVSKLKQKEGKNVNLCLSRAHDCLIKSISNHLITRRASSSKIELTSFFWCRASELAFRATFAKSRLSVSASLLISVQTIKRIINKVTKGERLSRGNNERRAQQPPSAPTSAHARLASIINQCGFLTRAKRNGIK